MQSKAKQSFDHFQDFMSEEIILGGDFNLVLDVKEDKKGTLPRTHQNALKIINQSYEEKKKKLRRKKRTLDLLHRHFENATKRSPFC